MFIFWVGQIGAMLGILFAFFKSRLFNWLLLQSNSINAIFELRSKVLKLLELQSREEKERLADKILFFSAPKILGNGLGPVGGLKIKKIVRRISMQIMNKNGKLYLPEIVFIIFKKECF